MNVEPIASSVQYRPEKLGVFQGVKAVTNTQPTATTTSKVIIAMASRMGVLRERRRDIMGENSTWADAPSSRGASPDPQKAMSAFV